MLKTLAAAGTGVVGVGSIADTANARRIDPGDDDSRLYSVKRDVVSGDFAEVHSAVSGPDTVSAGTNGRIAQQAVSFTASYNDGYSLPGSKNAEIRVRPKNIPGDRQYNFDNESAYAQKAVDNIPDPFKYLLKTSWSVTLGQLGVPAPFGVALDSDINVGSSDGQTEISASVSGGQLNGMEWAMDFYGPKGVYEFEVICERDLGYYQSSPKTGSRFWVPVDHVKQQHVISFTR